MQKRKDTLIRQKEIVSAARMLIVKYGSEHITVKRMAAEIGVTEAAIYRHFKSKRDILLFLIEDVESTLLEDIHKNHPSQLNSLEILSRIIMEHMSSIQQRKGVTFQVIAEIISLGDKVLNDKISIVIDNYISRIQEILAQGVQSGIIRSDIDLKATARVFFGMTQGLVDIWALSHYTFNLQEEHKPMWEVFLKATANPKAARRVSASKPVG